MTEPLTRPDVKILLNRLDPLRDPLRDQGRALAGEMAQGGSKVGDLAAAGTIHGFWSMRAVLPSSAADVTRCLAQLKLMLAA